MKSASMKDTISHYDRLDVGDPNKNYDFLVSQVWKRLEQARREQNRVELHSRFEQRGRSLAAAAIGDRPGGHDSPRYPKGVCRSWFTKGACSKGESCAVSHKREY